MRFCMISWACMYTSSLGKAGQNFSYVCTKACSEYLSLEVVCTLHVISETYWSWPCELSYFSEGVFSSGGVSRPSTLFFLPPKISLYQRFAKLAALKLWTKSNNQYYYLRDVISLALLLPGCFGRLCDIVHPHLSPQVITCDLALLQIPDHRLASFLI